MSKTTLVSLAESLGVSRQTVSNVINAPHRVKPETRMRVQHAIVESGYRPSAAARQLRTRRSMNFGIRNGLWVVMLILVGAAYWTIHTHELSQPMDEAETVTV